MRVRIVVPHELTSADLARWSECAARSIEPNPFFEPDWLLPAIECLDEAPSTVLVLAEHRGAIQACVPIVAVTSHQSENSGHGHYALRTRVAPTAVSLGTPLVTPGGGHDALACVVTEIRREAERRGAGLVIMEWMGHDGPTARLLRDVAVETHNLLVEFDVWERGILRRQDEAEESYWLRGIGKNRRRTIRQHYQHLIAALGGSPSLRIRNDGAAMDAFLQLEASGWKGSDPSGLAMWRQATTTKFFEAVCSRYMDNGRMWFASLELQDEPIAMICCVRAGEGVFAYRTAYDEDLARFGPGVQVFLAAMEHFDAETGAAWFDSCAVRDNQHLLGLFPDRRTLATLMFRVSGIHKSGRIRSHQATRRLRSSRSWPIPVRCGAHGSGAA